MAPIPLATHVPGGGPFDLVVPRELYPDDLAGLDKDLGLGKPILVIYEDGFLGFLGDLPRADERGEVSREVTGMGGGKGLRVIV